MKSDKNCESCGGNSVELGYRCDHYCAYCGRRVADSTCNLIDVTSISDAERRFTCETHGDKYQKSSCN